MRLIIDGVQYDANLKKVAEHLSSFYIDNSKKMQVIDVGPGKRLDFSAKSIMRTTMKAAMVPFVVPVIGMLYRMRGLPPPERKKHEDLIDWMVVKMIEFAGIVESDVQLNANSKAHEDDDGSHHRVIESISTAGSEIFNRRAIGSGQVANTLAPGTIPYEGET